MKTRPSPLWIFVGLALLIHAGVLAYFLPRLKPLEIRLSDQTASLSVSLQAVEISAPKSNPDQQAARKPARHTTAQAKTQSPPLHRPVAPAAKTIHQKKTEHIEPVAADKPGKIQPDSQAELARKENTASETPPALPPLNRARVLSRLHEDLSQYFYYPRLARRNNMQGTVTLGFAISRQGHIQDIRVVHSSGHAILDMAAEDALGKLQQLNWIKNRWQPDFANLELPVIYRLMEN